MSTQLLPHGGLHEGPYLPSTSTNPFILLLFPLHLVELEQRMQERFKRWHVGWRANFLLADLANGARAAGGTPARWYLRWPSPLLPLGRRE